MGERFQGGEGSFRGKVKHGLMRLNDFKVEGHHTVEQSVIGRKAVGKLRLIVQALPDRRGRFCHVNLLSFSFSLSKYTANRTYFQEMDQGLKPQSPYHALKRRGLRQAKAQNVKQSELIDDREPLVTSFSGGRSWDGWKSKAGSTGKSAGKNQYDGNQ